jgi:hypothetical protein
MKKGLVILILGLAIAVAGYGIVYFASTAPARSLEHCQQPELAWLKVEFHLDDAEFQRISALHAAYLPQCGEMCRRIDEQNQRVKALLAATNQMTPDIERAIAHAAELRGECQRNMLRHFYEVSRTMPPEEGRRYLQWVQERAFASDAGMMMPGK